MPTTKSATVESTRAGLAAGSEPVPLQGVSVDVDLTDFAARVTLTQRYRNVEDRAIEAVYTFPLDELAAVCGFEAIVGGVHYAGEIQMRDDAFRRYDDALQRGQGAFLLDEERPDVFVASVGNIPPGGEALIKITYATELVVDGEAVRFTLPTTVAPRYAPAEDRIGVGRPDAETLNPRREWTVPYGLDLHVRIAMSGAIVRIESPSHPTSVEIDGRHATVRLAHTAAALDRDVVLLVEAKELQEPHVRIERDEHGRLAAAIAVRPQLDAAVAPAEVIFVIDRSGSMEGSSIAEVRNALQLCLRSLVSGCRFNIVGFGSQYAALFDASRPYDDRSLAEASAHVQALDADLGGTEMLGALTFAFERPAVQGLPRNIVILTDGQVTNTDAVVAEVASHAKDARVFTFGVGRGASAHLVRGLARAGRGLAEFIYPGERIEAKVMRQFNRLLSPAIGDVHVRWGDLDATPVCTDLPPVFGGERLVTYAFLADVRATTVEVSARGSRGDVAFQAPIDVANVSAGRTLAILAARRRIRELEEHAESLNQFGSKQPGRTGDRRRDEIIRLSTTYGIVSRYTSFVAVEDREGAAATELALRRIPIALTSGWGGSDAPALPLQRRMTAASRVMFGRVTGSIDRLAPKARNVPFEAAEMRVREMLSSVARPLDAVVALQRANGSWNLTRDLAARVGIAFDRLQSARPDAIEPDVWATLVALAWLAAHASGDHVEWQGLADKSETWLTFQLAPEAIEAGRDAARDLVRG
jgi:Ca-activated chloride channel family protein